ncbi:Conserved oligomeric Golgi complex subunit 3 [Trichinella pseudospiralis]|uniref:Conserved oligomeric Golgi complex subunit 3 n=1 Tax=Trichinella pseudospiralis TaxID=6337 RepID=A0A0V1JR59_TRIPS|nr:Conserved oligomeric Golgi complex subunit 3 [Trichinella pseudospiralis]
MASSRPKRCTAGNRMQELLATLPPTDEFFSSTYGGFTEEKDDTDYKYVDEGKDEFDSDFGSTSDEESDAQQDADEDDDEDLDEERKKKKFEFRRHLHLSSLQKKAQPSAAPTEVTSPPSKKKKPESNFFTTQTFDKQLRNSTLRKSELSAERRQKVAQSTIKRQKRVTNYQPLTLEQMLEEAKLTELENQESLKRFHEMELEKKQKQNQPKKIKLEGSRIRTTSVAVPIPVKYLDRQNHPFCNPDKKVTSKTYSATVSSLHTPQIHVKTVIEFSNAETYQSIFSRFSKKPTIEKPKRCVTNFTNEEQTENDSRILKFYRKVVNLTTTTFDESDTLHQPYILQLVENISDIAHSLNDATEKLRELNNKYRTVANRTISLHDACNQLMTSQKLNSPLLSVTGESFLHLLNLIDDGIVFMSDHTTYKDSAFYLSKYKHCLTKALTLVKTYVSRTFENSTKAILEKAKSISDRYAESFPIYYCLFVANASQLQPLFKELEPKWSKSDEYANMLEQCYKEYFYQRCVLMEPSLRLTVENLVKENEKSCCSLIRHGCTTLFRFCDDEYYLMGQFFKRGYEHFNQFIENMARIFYNAIRPNVIHLQHLETLTELCVTLRTKILDERCYTNDVTDVVYKGLAKVLEELLGDLTERLLYRSQMFAANEIGNYNPAEGDLAYPEKLIMIREISKSMASSGEDTNNIGSNIQGLWYPTVRRTVMCLSKLYRCLDATSLQGISQEVMEMCIESLKSAKAKIETKSDELHAHLFFIQHLLILRAQTAPLMGDVFCEPSVDFSKIKESAVNLIHNKSEWLSFSSNNALLKLLLQVPVQTSEQVVDSRRHLDFTVKTACQNFIADSADVFVSEIKKYLTQVKAISNKNPNVDLARDCNFANPKIVSQLIANTYRMLKNNWPKFRDQLALYLCNVDIENTLATPVKRKIIAVLEEFVEVIKKRYSEEDVQLLRLPSSQEWHLLMS